MKIKLITIEIIIIILFNGVGMASSLTNNSKSSSNNNDARSVESSEILFRENFDEYNTTQIGI